MKIFLAIPSADAKVSIHTMASVLRTQSALAKQGIQVMFDMLDFAEVSVARNILAARFIASDCTHMLFCDDDISFEPQVIGDMISAQAPFVSAGCVKREFDLEKFAAARKQLEPGPADDENRGAALRAATSLNYQRLDPETRNGKFVEAVQTGFGLTLIHRDVFGALRAARVVATQAYGKRLTGGEVHGYFDRIHVEDVGSTLPEDYSFCRRWRQCGGQVWVLEGAQTRHHGEFAYQNW